MTLHRFEMFACILALITGFTLANPHFSLAQLRKLEAPNLVTQADIYTDEAGIRYSTAINVRFTDQVFFSDKKASLTRAELNPAYSPSVTVLLDRLEQRYGPFSINKKYPRSRWGDNQRVNKRTGKVVTIPDFSQVYVLRFASPVRVDEVTEMLSGYDLVSYAEGPEVVYMLDQSSPEAPYGFFDTALPTEKIPFSISPNDWLYNQFIQTGFAAKGEWGLSQVNAEAAWGISKGDGITIAISENWDTTSSCITTTPPTDLANGRLDNGAVSNCFSEPGNQWHGVAVASRVGAITDNVADMASLGWNVSMKGYTWGDDGIVDASNDPEVDIINASWRAPNSCNLEIAVHTALIVGKLIVAGNGNGPEGGFNPPVVTYPSGYDFRADHFCGNVFLESLGDTQVMAVAASDSSDKYLDYCPGNIPDHCPYNYSPGSDPVNNPNQAFMDVAAPGIQAWVQFLKTNASYTLVRRTGTSFAAPMVSALAALILATDNTLTPQQLYEVIIRGTAKVGQNAYTSTGLLGESWNQYFGYGRIDANYALLIATQNPLPLISGPSTLGVWEYGTWTAAPQYGITPFQYNWYYRYCNGTPYGADGVAGPGCNEPWTFAGSGTSFTRRDLVDFEIKAEVIDAKGKTGASTKSVFVGGSAPSSKAETGKATSSMAAAKALPSVYALEQNYPNPFREATEIRFALPEAGEVSLVVYDLMGREVVRLADGTMRAGFHSVEWRADTLPSGVYLFRLTAGAYAETRRMTLIR